MMSSLRRLLLMAIAIPLLTAGARAQSKPSVLVQLTPLRAGSLPRIVTAYGRIQPAPSAQRTVMAPLPAIVQTVLVRQGEAVVRNAPLLRIAPAPMVAASYAQAGSAVTVAEDLVARTRSLVAQHLATHQQLANAEKTLTDARATLAALRAQGAGGPRTVRAPFAAVVTALSVSPGGIVPEGGALLTLARPSGLVLQVGVTPHAAVDIAPGNRVRVTILGASKPLAGTVSLRGAVVEPTSGLVPVQISVPSRDLFAGEMAQASITTGEARGYVVPHEAILVNNDGATYVVQSIHMVARKVPVRILGHDGASDVVSGALDAAAPLVLSGNYQLDDGMRMRTAEAGPRASRATRTADPAGKKAAQ